MEKQEEEQLAHLRVNALSTVLLYRFLRNTVYFYQMILQNLNQMIFLSNLSSVASVRNKAYNYKVGLSFISHRNNQKMYLQRKDTLSYNTVRNWGHVRQSV